MNDRFDTRYDGINATGAGQMDAARDEGLRSYMLKIYNYMASGVLLTGVVAMLFAESGMAAQVMGTGIGFMIKLSPLAFILVLSFGVNKMSQATLQAVFWAFAVVMGLSMSTIFLVYTGSSIAVTFAATSVAFLSLSLYGYTTKKNLSGMGTFLMMGLVGLLVAIIANMFIGSGTLAMVISFIGVLIFAGLTAYDTQKLKSQYFYLQGTEFMGKAVILGAVELYLDFVNMFTFLLSFLGNRE
jgi:uncharacterized protein